MSHNPSRLDPRNHQRPSPPPGAGTSHAQIMAKRRGPSSAPAGDRKPTRHGYEVELFTCEAFSTKYEVVFSKNNTGRGVNHTGDRSIMVVRGQVFATVQMPDGSFDTMKMGEGHYLHVPHGTEYGLATSGVEPAELYITETPGYANSWEQLEEPTVGGAESIPDASIHASPTVVRRGVDPKTMQQAEEIRDATIGRRARAAARSSEGEFKNGNANSANVIGASPMPSGPPSE